MSIFDGGDAFTNFADQPQTAGQYVASTRTVNDVLRQVKRKFGDESGVQLEDNDIIGWVNDGQVDICERGNILKAKSSVTSIADQASYRWPAQGILSVDSLHFDGVKIDNVSFPQAEEDYISSPSIPDTAQSPLIWYEWAGQFTLYPTPTRAAKIDLYYSRVPLTVSLPTDVLSIPDRYFNTLIHYVLKQAYEMDEDWQAVTAKSTEYTNDLTAFGDEERTAQNMTYGTITESYPY